LIVVVAIILLKGGALGETQETVRIASLNLGLLENPAYAVPLQIVSDRFTPGGSSVYAPCESTEEVLECQPVHIINNDLYARRLTVIRLADSEVIYDGAVPSNLRATFDIRAETPGYWPYQCYEYYWDGNSAAPDSWSLGNQTACSGIGGSGAGSGSNFPTVDVTLFDDIYSGDISFNYTPADDVGFASASLFVSMDEGATYSEVASNASAILNGLLNTITYHLTEGTYYWRVEVCDTDFQCTTSSHRSFNSCPAPGTIVNISYCPYFIRCPGEYHVNASLSNCGNGVKVDTTHDVIIDCLGNSFTGHGAVVGAGIDVRDSSHVHIRNCVVTDFETTIQLQDTEDSEVSHNDVDTCSQGIQVKGKTKNNKIDSNNVKKCTTGIDFDGGQNNTVSNNNANENNYGLIMKGNSESDCRDNTITENHFDNSDREGIALIGTDTGVLKVTGNKLTNNTATESADYGLHISSSDVFSNTLSGNDFSDAGVLDVYSTGGVQTEVKDNCGANKCKQTGSHKVCDNVGVPANCSNHAH